ncbi:MAG: hypothetical protein Q7R41_09800, partial [Phycisphaerales bacterium]|nr:hypothetical protein [Phycisphaerales bacterium]
GTWLLNGLSIHRMYEQRIRRTWIISGVPPSQKARDDLRGKDWERTWVRPDLTVGGLAAEPEKITSPYPMWVTALNMAGSTNVALLGRKSDGFVIGPVVCGSRTTGWVKTEESAAFRNMRLSTAATISGAAVSPNMGTTTHPTLAIAMTLFNVRLGMWVKNPLRPTKTKERVISALQRLFSVYWNELGGRASHRGAWVYLSDGGHFENLGIYELLRRRCKYIIAVDATGEPGGNGPLNFGGIGIPLRMARTDFGVEVKLDIRPLERDLATGHAGSYFAVGRIRYPKAEGGHGNPDALDSDRDTGYLVVIKSSLVDRTVPPDVINYFRQENSDFPYDSTVDQQFAQPQFESYRQLGFIAGAAVADAAVGSTLDMRFQALHQAYQSRLAVP